MIIEKINELSKKYLPDNPPVSTRVSSDLTPYTGDWTEREVIHLLKRVSFGARKEDIQFFSGKNLNESISELFSNYSEPPNPPVNDYSSSDPEVPLGKVWVNTAGEPGMQFARRYSFKGWWLNLMRTRHRSAVEKLTLFFHSLVPTEADVVAVGSYIYEYNVILRKHCLGNYKAMLTEITNSPAMLRYLNGDSNTKSAPDENYARELQELFTIGKGPNSKYTEDDVKAAARILTGFRIDNQKGLAYFDAKKHDTTDKLFSSFYGNRIIKGRADEIGAREEITELLDMIFDVPEASKYICRAIYRYFVYYEIDDFVETNIIEPLAEIFRSNNFEIKPVFVALFSSAHFFDEANRACMIKSPLDHCIGFFREIGFEMAPEDKLEENYYFNNLFRSYLSSIQQEPGDPPSVSGWPAYYQLPSYHRLWANTDTYPKRIAFTERMITYGYTRNKITILADIFLYVQKLDDALDPNRLLEELLQQFYAIPTSLEFRNYLKKTYLLSGQETDGYWSEAWANYIKDPNNQMYLNEVKNRLLPLFRYLMKLPEYHLA